MVEFHDFFTAAVDHEKYLTEQNIDYIYSTFDQDGDGQIDIEEFQFVVPSKRWEKMIKEFKEDSGIESQGATVTKAMFQ